MIFELLVKDIPHQKINQEFREFLFKELELKNAHLVHHQQKDNKKVLLLRVQEEEIYKRIIGRKFTYDSEEIDLMAYSRPIIDQINERIKLRKELFEAGKVDPENEILSKIYLSNVPKYLKEPELQKIMSKFGHVKNITLPHKNPTSLEKSVKKCRLAVVEFETFEEAVRVFFLDKIKIRDKKIKIKLYINNAKELKNKMNPHKAPIHEETAKENAPKLLFDGEQTGLIQNNIEEAEEDIEKSLKEEEILLQRIRESRKNLQLDTILFKKDIALQQQMFNDKRFSNYSNPSSGNGCFYYAYDPYLELIKARTSRREAGFLNKSHQELYKKCSEEVSRKVEIGEKSFRLRKGLNIAKTDDIHFEDNIRFNVTFENLNSVYSEFENERLY